MDKEWGQRYGGSVSSGKLGSFSSQNDNVGQQQHFCLCHLTWPEVYGKSIGFSFPLM